MSNKNNTKSNANSTTQFTTTSFAYIAIILTLVFAGLPQALAYTSTTPNLNASLLYYNPVPATPGSILEVYVQIENTGNTAKQVMVEFVDNGPFTLDNPTDMTKNIGTIPAGESSLIKYRVQVGKDALPGTNYVKIQYSIDGTTNYQSTLLPIDVQSTTASVEVESVTLEPKTFSPGSTGSITINLLNTAGLKITSGTVKLDLTSVDMAPIGGTNQQRFTDMQANERQQFKFELAPNPNIVPGVYKIPLLISFKDQKGTSYDMTEYVGIPVGVEPDLLVYFDKTTVASKTKTGTATIKFVNKGLSQIKFLDMQVLDSSDFKITSESNRIYVGNINQDDYESVDLALKLTKDTVTVPIKVTYKDALNRPYETTINLPLSTIDVNTPTSTNWSTIILTIVVVGLVAYFVIGRWRKAKR